MGIEPKLISPSLSLYVYMVYVNTAAKLLKCWSLAKAAALADRPWCRIHSANEDEIFDKTGSNAVWAWTFCPNSHVNSELFKNIVLHKCMAQENLPLRTYGSWSCSSLPFAMSGHCLNELYGKRDHFYTVHWSLMEHTVIAFLTCGDNSSIFFNSCAWPTGW